MTVGLLIVTHNLIGSELLNTAISMLGKCPVNAEAIAVTMACDPEEVLQQAKQKIELLDQGAGVIILTDMYGSTPANVTKLLQHDSASIDVIAGINLPMVVRLLNYSSLDRAQMIEKALSGGREGIFACQFLEDETD